MPVIHRDRIALPCVWLCGWLCMAWMAPAFAQQATIDPTGTRSAAPNPPEDAAPERVAVHGQLTFLEQLTSPFHDPYSGPNSLSPRRGAETFDTTLFMGARLWSGAEAWADPELDQGFGLDNTVGMAGFPSGTAYKVGRSHPYFRLQRLFVRQTIDLGGEAQPVEASANQLGGSQSANRWVFSAGKISIPDIFDVNQYAHDPRNDFLNWAAIDTGTFDYAADSWGYTVGAAAEWYQGAWTARAGIFDLSKVPNSETLDHGLHEFQWVGELEKRHELMGSPGKLLLTLFDSRAHMGLLDQAVSIAQVTGESVDIALVEDRRYRSRAGAGLGLEQQLSADVGMFARAGKASGNSEVYEFSEIDRTVLVGVSVKGSRWKRTDDTVGVVVIDNGISADRERFLNAGGLGILVGDGQLPHPGAEQILETYYRWAAVPWAQFTFDYQYAINPAYNTGRGPVSIFALRVHAQF
jgi:high affinity Mn2+ porin